ncbi:MAG TPA: hypothetical protein VJN90_02050, partial [Candidatus Acidoferrales bacterium]|nr:hypothetical protein [Candidatus Acidoferrales bacterium]
MKKLLLVLLFLAGVNTLTAQSKTRVDLIIAGGTVVTMDSALHIYNDGAVAVRGDTIVAVSSRESIASRYEAARTIEARDEIVMPGLINGHQHAAMSLFRGLADDLALNDWLQKYIFPAEARNVTP